MDTRSLDCIYHTIINSYTSAILQFCFMRLHSGMPRPIYDVLCTPSCRDNVTAHLDL